MNSSGGTAGRFVVVIGALFAAPAAMAYVGPGAGLSLVGALWGLILAIFAALAFVLMWPIRRLMRRRKTAAKDTAPHNQATRVEQNQHDDAEDVDDDKR